MVQEWDDVLPSIAVAYGGGNSYRTVYIGSTLCLALAIGCCMTQARQLFRARIPSIAVAKAFSYSFVDALCLMSGLTSDI